jgi:hypothetical protein
MIAMRLLFQTLIETAFNLHLYCDALPQWRGLETYAASFDLREVSGEITRRLCPVIALERDMLNAIAKTVGLLWQIVLVVGLDFPAVRRVCNRISSLTTDFGVERWIADQPDWLDVFFEFVGAKPRGDIPNQTWMFPRCMSMPGWRHVWDGIIKRGCNSLVWWPIWFDQFKGLVKFLRTAMYADELDRWLIHRGLLGIASMIRKTSIKGFAKWRWGTLKDSAKSISKFFLSLKAVWCPGILAPLKDHVLWTKVCACFASDLWHARFVFVCWYSEWISSIQEWIGGCDCPAHEAARALGERVVHCITKGRRIKTAYGYACARLREGLDWINQSSPADFGGFQPLWEGPFGQITNKNTFKLLAQKSHAAPTHPMHNIAVEA